MKAKIGITVLAVIFVPANSSCEYTGTLIDDKVIIKVVNSEGKNMFDSNTKNAINIDSIKIYRRLANGDTIAAENNYNFEANKGKGFSFSEQRKFLRFYAAASTTKHPELKITEASSVYPDRVYINRILCGALEHIFPFAIYNLDNNLIIYLCASVFARAIGKGKYYR